MEQVRFLRGEEDRILHPKAHGKQMRGAEFKLCAFFNFPSTVNTIKTHKKKVPEK